MAGKIAQSLRDYTEDEGGPDLDLEQFVINSILPATHTSELSDEEKQEMIHRIKTSGQGDEESPEDDIENGKDPEGEEQPPEDGEEDIENGGEEQPPEEEIDSNDGEDKEEPKEGVENSNKNSIFEQRSKTKKSLKDMIEEKLAHIESDEKEKEPATKPNPTKPRRETKPKTPRRSKPYKVPKIDPDTNPDPKGEN